MMQPPILDRSEIQQVLFHPRRYSGIPYSTSQIRLSNIEVEQGIRIGGRLYPAGKKDALILYFHGNGEIASDYDSIAPIYTQMGVSLLVVDYRGYGRSGGTPTANNLLTDAIIVLNQCDSIIKENDLAPSQLYVMGRSLGSAAAIEVAGHAGSHLSGMIIESGFADSFALLARLGLRIQESDEDLQGFGNLNKIRMITTPTLIIHGQQDILIPPQDGHDLYNQSGASEKNLVIIPGGGHNNLMVAGFEQYFKAIRDFVFRDTIRPSRK